MDERLRFVACLLMEVSHEYITSKRMRPVVLSHIE